MEWRTDMGEQVFRDLGLSEFEVEEVREAESGPYGGEDEGPGDGEGKGRKLCAGEEVEERDDGFDAVSDWR